MPVLDPSRAAPADIVAIRRRWADAMVASAGVDDPALVDAFAAVPREAFLPDPPWTVFGGVGRRIMTRDPALLYDDVLVALDPARGVNNGSPSLHAAWIAALGVRPGDRIAHIGAGAGHYSAILARLAGRRGRVEAVEIDPALAAFAARELAGLGAESAPVEVIVADGTTRPSAEVDRVYVNFAVAAPARPWLDRLAPGGRLVMPLCVPLGEADGGISGEGVGLLVERVAEGFAARALGGCCFVWAEAATMPSPAAIDRLNKSFRAGGIAAVRSLRLAPIPVSERAACWYVGDDWALSTEPPGG